MFKRIIKNLAKKVIPTDLQEHIKRIIYPVYILCTVSLIRKKARTNFVKNNLKGRKKASMSMWEHIILFDFLTHIYFIKGEA